MNDFLARAGAVALAFQAFCAAHPEISVPLIGALLTFLVKPRTPEQYAAMPPRLAAGLQLFAAIFPDPVKAAKVATKFLTGRDDSLPPPPPAPHASGVVVPIAPKKRGGVSRAYDPAWRSFGVLAIALHLPLLTGCAFLEKHAKDALSVAQIACILANQAAPDSKVAEICDVADDYFEPMQRVLADARKASDKAAAHAAESTRAAHCGRD